MTNNDLIAMLREAEGWMARHVFGPDSPACLLCGGESGFDVGRSCPQAPDYNLRQRILTALAEPVETVALRDENLALRAALRLVSNSEDWKSLYLVAEATTVRLLSTVGSFAKDEAAHECHYGDECPPGTRHGTCTSCKARRALLGAKIHVWAYHGEHEACRHCGVVRRADDGNKPCRGIVMRDETCANCGEQKSTSKICGHCAEDL